MAHLWDRACWEQDRKCGSASNIRDDEESVYTYEQGRHEERERERDRHKETLYFLSDSYKRHQPLLKVTKSLYIVTILGQLPFMLFIEITRTWVVQRDNVNTAIIHSYSTVPSHDTLGLQKGLIY